MSISGTSRVRMGTLPIGIIGPFAGKWNGPPLAYILIRGRTWKTCLDGIRLRARSDGGCQGETRRTPSADAASAGSASSAFFRPPTRGTNFACAGWSSTSASRSHGLNSSLLPYSCRPFPNRRLPEPRLLYISLLPAHTAYPTSAAASATISLTAATSSEVRFSLHRSMRTE